MSETDGLLYLGINGHPNGLFYVGSLIQKDSADTICVAHHGDPGVILDVLHERVASSRNDQVNISIAFQQRRDLGACLDRLDVGFR